MQRTTSGWRSGPKGWVKAVAGSHLPLEAVAPPVLAEKLRFIQHLLPLGLAVNLVIALCLAGSILGSSAGPRLGVWLGLNLAVGLLRFADAWAIRRQGANPDWPARGCRHLILGALAQGCLWGMAGIWLFPAESINQLFLLTVMSGMSGGAIIFLAPVWPAYLAYLLPGVLPVSLRLILVGAAPHQMVGVMGLAYCLAMILASGRSCRLLDDSLKAALDKDQLTRELIIANQGHKEYRAQLEAAVWERTLDLSSANQRLQSEMASKDEERERAIKAEAQYRALFDAMNEGFAHVDQQEVFLFANPAAERIFGVDRGTLAGRCLLDFLDPQAICQVRQETSKRVRGESSTYCNEITRPDGQRRLLQMRVSPVWDGDGRFAGTSGVFQDITDQKASEEALRQAQKLESLGVLAGGIAHDFNNLLSAILGNLNLLQLEAGPDSPSQAYLASMESAVNRATDLTRQMLAYSGKGRFLVRDLDLSGVIQDLASLLQVNVPVGAELRLDLAADLPMVAADLSQVQQVLMNLVANGAEALDGGQGEIHLRTRALILDPEAAARASTVLRVSPGPHVLLEVSDTGKGMDPEVLSRVFDPFFTTKEAGRGLGMSAMLGILRGHGAGIEITSQATHGSCFRLYFPVSASTAEAPRAQAAGHSPAFQGRVLLVDDEPAILETASVMFHRLGFQVLLARDGVEAMDCLRDQRGGIGLVLLDLNMPRMNGHQTFKAIRELSENLPVILSSGYDAKQTLHQLQGPGAPSFLQKPYTFHALRHSVASALGGWA